MEKNIVRVNLEIVNEHPLCLMRIDCEVKKSDDTTETFLFSLDHYYVSDLFTDKKLVDETQLPKLEQIARAIAEVKFGQPIKDIRLISIARLEGAFVEMETKTIFS